MMRNWITISENATPSVAQELASLVEDAVELGVELEVSNNFATIYLTGLYREGGAKGNGALIMDRLCTIADRHNMEIMLDAEGGSEGLFDYYSRWGFELEQDVIDDMAEEEDYPGPWVMYRLPR